MTCSHGGFNFLHTLEACEIVFEDNFILDFKDFIWILINKLAAAELCCCATADGNSDSDGEFWILNLTLECDGQTWQITPSIADLFNNKPFSNR